MGDGLAGTGGVALAAGKKNQSRPAGAAQVRLAPQRGQVLRVAFIRHMSYENDFTDEL